MTFADAKKGIIENGYKCIKEASTGFQHYSATFTLDNSQEWSEAQRQEWETRRLLRQAEARIQEKAKRENSLTADQRHNLYSKILDSLKLDITTISDLKKRGFTQDEINDCGFVSVEKWQKLPFAVNPQLPGISAKNTLIVSGDGYLCPIRTYDGQVAALQLRLLLPDDSGRYRWVSSDKQTLALNVEGKLENPLAVFKPVGKPSGIALVEGTGAKPFLASRRLNKIVIGAAGGQFAGSPKLLRNYLDRASQDTGSKEVFIYPDAGDVLNKSVLSRWEQVSNLITSFGYEAKFGWWGQVNKDAPDIDELTDFRQIEYITPDEFLSLGSVDNTSVEEANEESISDWAWKQWVNSRKFTPDLDLGADKKFFEFPTPKLDTVLAGCSGTGTGKTTWLINNIIKPYSDCGFLALGYRNSNLLQLLKDIEKIQKINKDIKGNWYHLQKDLKQTKEELLLLADITSKILACIDSLIYFSPQDFDGKILILDEIESIIKHLFGSNTSIARYRNKIQELFKEALNRSSMVVLLDGHLSDKTTNFIMSLMDDSKKLIKVKNLYKGNKGKVKLLLGAMGSNGKLKPKDCSAIREAIKKNQGNITVVSDSQKEIQALDEILIKQGCKTLRFDGTTSSKEWVESFLEDPKKYIKDNKIEVLLYSPSAEAGINIDIVDYFSHIYVMFFGVITTDAQLQMIARVRDKAAEIVIWCECKGLPSNSVHKSATPEGLEKVTKEYVIACGAASFDNHAQKEALAEYIKKVTEISDTPFFKHNCYLAWKEDFEREHLRKCLKQGLLDSGYQVEEFTTKKFCSKDVAEKKVEIKERESDIIAKVDITNFNDSTAQKISGNIAATIEEKAKVVKYNLLKRLPGIDKAVYPVDQSQKTEVQDKPSASEEQPQSPLNGTVEQSQPSTTETTETNQPVAELEKPIFDSSLVKLLIFDNPRLISQLETRWLIENPEAAQEFQQIKWHKKLSIFTDPEKPDSEKGMDLLKYKSQWLKIKTLIEMGITYFLTPGAEWNPESPELIKFWEAGGNKRNATYIGIDRGKQNPCEYLGRVLKTLGVKTQSTTNKKARTYRLKEDCPVHKAIYESINVRLTSKLIDDKSKVSWDTIISRSQTSQSDVIFSQPEIPQSQAEQAIQAAHLPGNYYINNQQGAPNLNSQEDTTLAFPHLDTNSQSPTINDLDNAIAQLKAASDWGQIASIPQELINQAWQQLTPQEDAQLRQLHQQWQSQPQPQLQRVRWYFDRFGTYLLLEVKGAIAKIKSTMTGETFTRNYSELEFIAA